jgi:amino acid transporter
MRDLAIIALTSIVMLLPMTWAAAGLLALRDRHFPREPRLERAGPWYPPKWARGRWTARLFRAALAPVILLALTMFLIVMLPVYIWNRMNPLVRDRRS